MLKQEFCKIVESTEQESEFKLEIVTFKRMKD